MKAPRRTSSHVEVDEGSRLELEDCGDRTAGDTSIQLEEVVEDEVASGWDKMDRMDVGRKDKDRGEEVRSGLVRRVEDCCRRSASEEESRSRRKVQRPWAPKGIAVDAEEERG